MNCSALYTALNFFGCKLKGTCSSTSVQATRSMPPEMNSQPGHWLHHGLEHGGMIRSLLDCCSSLLAETATWRAEGVTSPSSPVKLLSVRKSNCRATSCNHTFVAGSALKSAMISVSRRSSLMRFFHLTGHDRNWSFADEL